MHDGVAPPGGFKGDHRACGGARSWHWGGCGSGRWKLSREGAEGAVIYLGRIPLRRGRCVVGHVKPSVRARVVQCTALSGGVEGAMRREAGAQPRRARIGLHGAGAASKCNSGGSHTLQRVQDPNAFVKVRPLLRTSEHRSVGSLRRKVHELRGSSRCCACEDACDIDDVAVARLCR